MSIRNIIFDLCGPIVTIDLELMNRRFRDFGVKAEKPYQLLRSDGLTKMYEAGEISTGEFCRRVRHLLAAKLGDTQILEAWNTIVADFPESHIECIRELHHRCRLFLLSNSDVTNARFFREYLNSQAGFDFVEDCFDGVFFSYNLHERKPNPAVFQRIVDKHGLATSETLVVDDCRKHCEGAASIGLHTHWLQHGEDICELDILTAIRKGNGTIN